MLGQLLRLKRTILHQLRQIVSLESYLGSGTHRLLPHTVVQAQVLKCERQTLAAQHGSMLSLRVVIALQFLRLLFWHFLNILILHAPHLQTVQKITNDNNKMTNN